MRGARSIPLVVSLSNHAAPRERAGYPPQVGHRRWAFFSSLLGMVRWVPLPLGSLRRDWVTRGSRSWRNPIETGIGIDESRELIL